MSLETIFIVTNSLAMAGWLLLFVAPYWKWSARLISGVVIPFLLGLVHFYFVVTYAGSAGGDFTSLQGIAQLFENPQILLAGWVHYLAFDLFVGSWQVRDSQRVGIRYWFLAPCLLVTLFAGPSGLVLYFVIRWVVARRIYLAEATY